MVLATYGNPITLLNKLEKLGITCFASNPKTFEEITNSLKKLMVLPENFIVYPGHGPITTIGEEKRSNPLLQK